jgi:hypothetical protein
MKNVIVILLSSCKTKTLALKTFDNEKKKYIWSLPNMELHWDVTQPKLPGKKAFQKLFEMFTFGLVLFEEKTVKKLHLPSTNQAFIYVCKEGFELENIIKVFENTKKHFINVNIIKLEFLNVKDFSNVQSYSKCHYESIEAIQYFLDCLI